jgi:hypothetical protein
MDKVQPITRRAALIGALVSSTVIAVPAAAAVHLAEQPNERVRRLAHEMQEALNDAGYIGHYRRVTVTADQVMYGEEPEPLPAVDRFEQHFDGMCDALDELTDDADGWRLTAGRDHEAAVFRQVKRTFVFNEEVGPPGRTMTIPVQRHRPVDEVRS